MGIYDRDYTKVVHDGQGPRVHWGLPPLTPAVKWLLIANVAIFLFEYISGQMRQGAWNYFEEWGAASAESWLIIAQVWRLVTYQFLHSGWGHIIINMLWLFFLGPRMEGHLGTRRFIVFYLLCGIVAALVYMGVTMTGLLPGLLSTDDYLVGASGSILAILAAAAILIPHERVIFLIFPMSIRLAAIIMIVVSFFGMGGRNTGGEVAHLGGIAAGAAYAWLWPKLSARITGKRRGNWDKRMEQQRRLQLEIDRVLDKVHEQGLASLSRQEKKMLQEATKLEQERRRNIEID